MMDLTRPCGSCPFRTDKPFYLGSQRRGEIARDLSYGLSFLCHKTVHYGEQDWDEEEDRYKAKGDEDHCAGAMIVLQKEDKPNQAMQVMERLGFFDPSKLVMDSPVFDSLEDFIEKGA